MSNTLETQVADYVAAFQHIAFPVAEKTGSKPVLSDNEKQVFIAAEKAWQSYSSSPEGQSQLTAFKSMDLAAARVSVAGILDSPFFEDVINLINSLNLIPKSFSIGLNFEVEFILGFAGTIGAAIGIGDSKGVQSSEFLSLSIVEGIDGGAMAGVQFGLWTNSPADLGGYAWGTQLIAGVDVEGSIEAYYTASNGILGVSLTVGAGLDEGGDEAESYTFILGDQGGDPYLKPVYQSPKNNLLIIQSVYCDHPSDDGLGNENEIYFIFQADGGTKYPYPTYDYFSMQQKDTWECGRSVWFDSSVYVTVYDSDDTSSDDVLGTFSINISNLTLNQVKTFNSTKDYSHGLDNIAYKLNVILVAKDVQN